VQFSAQKGQLTDLQHRKSGVGWRQHGTDGGALKHQEKSLRKVRGAPILTKRDILVDHNILLSLYSACRHPNDSVNNSSLHAGPPPLEKLLSIKSRLRVAARTLNLLTDLFIGNHLWDGLLVVVFYQSDDGTVPSKFQAKRNSFQEIGESTYFMNGSA
jgi:hypothetical protein